MQRKEVDQVVMTSNETIWSHLHSKEFGHFTIHALTEDLPPLETIDAERPVREALAKMGAKNYSQLPVIQEKTCIGAITLESVIKQLEREDQKGNLALRFMDWSVKRFVDKNTRFVRHEDDLLNHVEWMAGKGFVIVGSREKWESIVTNYDLVYFFKNETEVFLLVREIETYLRFTVFYVLGKKKLKEALLSLKRKIGPPPSSINDLTLDELRQLIHKNWRQLENIFLDERKVDNQLGKIRQLRNRVFHFRGRISALELNSIKRLRNNYRNLAISLAVRSKPTQYAVAIT